MQKPSFVRLFEAGRTSVAQIYTQMLLLNLMYWPSVAGCSPGSEAGTSAGQHLRLPPAARCSPGQDSGGADSEATARGWPEGSGRSCWLPGSAAGATRVAGHGLVLAAGWIKISVAEGVEIWCCCLWGDSSGHIRCFGYLSCLSCL